jgi:monofunctional biosynthetic peptidoglycan transglycosylase
MDLSASSSSRPKPHAVRRVFRAAILLVAAVLLLPYALTPLYLVVNPVSTPMIWRWLSGARAERSYVPLSAIAPVLPVTVIVAEDARFCSHSGIDWTQVREAIGDADDLSEVRGGSTITQQVAKNLFLWQGRSFVRKALEFPLAYWIDLIVPKRRIMEIYLNIAEWGPNGEFGAEAGARYAFGKPAANLTPREAVLMTAVLPNPKRRSARHPGPGVRRLAGLYEARARASRALAQCVLRGRP